MQMSSTAESIADTIYTFKHETLPYNTSPPNLNQEQRTVRNLAIIDLANALAESLLATGEIHDKDQFLTRALTRK